MSPEQEVEYLTQIAKLKVENERLKKSFRSNTPSWQLLLESKLIKDGDVHSVYYSERSDEFSINILDMKSSELLVLAKTIIEMSTYD